MNLDRPRASEKLGIIAGAWLAPITAAVSATRQARMFHPDGLVLRAAVEPCAAQPDVAGVAARLAGAALVRFSSALWRGDREWPDVLGVAVRFGWSGSAPNTCSEQDLLLATIRFPWTMPFAPLATNFRSYLWNHYHAVSPFEVAGVGRVKLRLRSPRLGNGGSRSRARHLLDAVGDGRATFELQLRRLEVSPLARRWEPVARLKLEAPLEVDQAALRFSPFRAGAGIEPSGFVHALRIAAYAASQEARPTHEAGATSV
jgi:hypothetical protein